MGLGKALRRRADPFLIASALIVSLSAAAQAGAAFMPEVGPASPPSGYVAFCQATPEECSGRETGSSQHLTEETWGELSAANTLANLIVAPLSDLDHYNKEEVWALPGSYGDCEDYALLKRKWLVQQGWPSGTLLLSVVFDEVGEGHAVLVARTDRGDLVLDNKTDEIRLWTETPYRFVKRQSAGDPSRWVKIGPAGNRDMATAARPKAHNPAGLWGWRRTGR